jgi:hypothetical protein
MRLQPVVETTIATPFNLHGVRRYYRVPQTYIDQSQTLKCRRMLSAQSIIGPKHYRPKALGVDYRSQNLVSLFGLNTTPGEHIEQGSNSHPWNATRNPPGNDNF